MKKGIYILSIIILVLILSACTMSASKAPKVTQTVAVKATSIGTAIAQAQAATSTSQKANIATQLPAGKEATLEPTKIPAETAIPVEVQATDTPGQPAPQENAVRLNYKSGGNSASARGDLTAKSSNRYILSMDAGRNIRVEVWSPNGDVHLSILDGNGTELLSNTLKANQWNGKVSAGGDITLAVYASGGTTSFRLDVEVTVEKSTKTPKPTTEPKVTNTPKPTSETIATGPFDPSLVYGAPSMSDPMNGGNLTDWMATDGSLPNTDSIKLTSEDTQFFVTAKKPGWATWWFSPISLDDVYMEITVETQACSGKDSYGMIMRGPKHGAGKSYGYIFAFSCDGYFQITRLDSTSPYSAVTLVGWTYSESIVDGSFQNNILGIKMDGKNLVLYANGYQLYELSDQVYGYGRYGLYIASDASVDFTYRIAKMAYWILGTEK